MILKIDEKENALYFRLTKEKIIGSEEVEPGIILDFDSNDQMVGIEILNIDKLVKKEELKSLEFTTV